MYWPVFKNERNLSRRHLVPADVEVIRRVRHPNTLGGIGLACVVLWWLPLLLPKRLMEAIFDHDTITNLCLWIIIVGMIVLPITAALRGSKWWFLVGAAGATSLCLAVLHYRPLP